MNITTNITLDLSAPSFPPVVDAVQYDSDTRYIAITITDNGSPWDIPTGTIGIVNIQKPDGTICFYEDDANNEPAVTFDANVATCLLVPQALTVAGEAYCDLSLYNANSQKITTFFFRLQIQAAAVPDDAITSTNYYNILTQEIAAALGAAQAVIDLTVSAQTLESSQPASVTKTTSGNVINLDFGIPQGVQGIQGPQGEPGRGLDIMGTYATLEALQAAVTEPAQGDMYNVGTAEPYTVYMWDETTEPGSWISQGQIRGPQGPQGETGATGATGPQGETGEAATITVGTVTTGQPGTGAAVTNTGTANAAIFNFTIPQGIQGKTGPQGETGATGATGPQGETGPHFTPSVSPEGVLSWTNNGDLENPAPVNIRGPQGEQGIQGETGPQGIQGPQGEKGETGTGLDIKGTYDTLEALQASVTQPAQGDMYNVGTAAPYTIYMWDETEPPGSWISQGQLQGAQGPAGPQGEQGPEGAQGPQGETGATGEQGPQGEPGAAATIQVGTVTTGNPGTQASVTNSGTASAAVFDFVIPQGPQGEQGIQGIQGEQGIQGPEGPEGKQGPAGPQGPNAVTSETSTTFNGLLKGNGTTVEQAVAGTDYQAPTQTLNRLGPVIDSDTIIPVFANNENLAIPVDILVQYISEGFYPLFQTLPENDLNSCTTPGAYIVKGTGVANVPTEGVFLLFVGVNGSGGYGTYIQVCAGGNDNANYLYFRAKYPLQSEWNAWQACASTTYVGQQIQSITPAQIGAQAARLTFENQTVDTTAWVSDTTYTDYPYRAPVACGGVTADMFAEVVLSPSDATGGNIAPVCETYAGGVYLYAKAVPDAAITIPTIIVWR